MSQLSSLPPSNPPYVRGGAAADQLVVALRHEKLVRQELERLGVHQVSKRDEDQLLGLALLTLDGTGLRRFAGAQPEGAAPKAATRRDAPEYGLDVLLEVMYPTFEQRYNGWVPTMGKNRAVTRVQHNIDGGGEGAPEPWDGKGLGKARKLPEPRRDVAVAIADTPVWPHEWFDGLSLAADPLLPRPAADPAREFTAGHGTFVAGVVHGEAPSARLELFSCLKEDGSGDSWDVAKRLVRIAGSRVGVLNMSFGCLTEDNRPPLVLSTAIDRLDAEMVLVAAAGNHGNAELEADRTRPLYPAALDEVVAVGATGPDGEEVAWSPDPAVCPWIDVLASAVGVKSAFLPKPVTMSKNPGQGLESPDRYATWSGTSFAAARVSGAIAQMMSEDGRSGREAVALLLGRLQPVPGGGPPWLPGR